MDEGLDELSSGIEFSRRIMGPVGMPQFSTMIAEMLLLRGDVTAAQGCSRTKRFFVCAKRERFGVG